MLTLSGGQAETLFDLGLPVEVCELPADLAALDALLDDPAQDAARMLACEAKRAGVLAGEDAPRVTDRSRSIGVRLQRVNRSIAGRTGHSKDLALRLTGEAGDLAAKSLGEARRLSAMLRRRARGRGAQAKLRAADRLDVRPHRPDGRGTVRVRGRRSRNHQAPGLSGRGAHGPSPGQAGPVRSILRQSGHGASLDAGRIPHALVDWRVPIGARD